MKDVHTIINVLSERWTDEGRDIVRDVPNNSFNAIDPDYMEFINKTVKMIAYHDEDLSYIRERVREYSWDRGEHVHDWKRLKEYRTRIEDDIKKYINNIRSDYGSLGIFYLKQTLRDHDLLYPDSVCSNELE